MSKSILVIAAHPDDEILGLGGTLKRHVHADDKVHTYVMCEGVSMRYQDRIVPQREHGMKAANMLGFETFEMLEFPDQHLDTMSLVDVIKPIEEWIREHRPQVVYTHFGSDLNRDHQIIFEATLVASRPYESSIEELYCYETPSSTEWQVPMNFRPDRFVNISEFLADKLDAFACYESEVRPYPHPRSLESLRNRAHYWGNMIGVDAAEAFVTCRSIWR